MTIRNTPRKPTPVKAKNVVVQIEVPESKGGVIAPGGYTASGDLDGLPTQIVAYGYYDDSRGAIVRYAPNDTLRQGEPLYAMFSSRSGITYPWERIFTEAEAREMGSTYFDTVKEGGTETLST